MSLGTYKVVLLGEGRVGKTSIASRFVDDTFDSGQVSTVQANMYSKKRIPVEGTLDSSKSGERSKGRKYVDIALWDTAGQERYHALGPIYYRNANGAILVYDITDADTFERIRMWIKELRQVVGDGIHIVICGNKSDLESEREVNLAMAEKFARSQGASHFSTSAKTNEGVAEAFQCLVQKILASLGLLDSSLEEGKRTRGKEAAADGLEGGEGENDDNDEGNDANNDEFPSAGNKQNNSGSKSSKKSKQSSPTTRRAGVKIAIDDDEDEGDGDGAEESAAQEKKKDKDKKKSSAPSGGTSNSSSSSSKKGAAKIAANGDETTVSGGTSRGGGGFGYDDYGSYGDVLSYHQSSSVGATTGRDAGADVEEEEDEPFISGGGGGSNAKNSSTKPSPPSASKRAGSEKKEPSPSQQQQQPQQKKSQPITLDGADSKKKEKKKDSDCPC